MATTPRKKISKTTSKPKPVQDTLPEPEPVVEETTTDDAPVEGPDEETPKVEIDGEFYDAKEVETAAPSEVPVSDTPVPVVPEGSDVRYLVFTGLPTEHYTVDAAEDAAEENLKTFPGNRYCTIITVPEDWKGGTLFAENVGVVIKTPEEVMPGPQEG